MSTDPHLSPSEKGPERFIPLDAFEKFVESRRQALDALIWQVPPLSVAAQAFLYIVALNPGSSDGVQIFVGAIGFVAASAAFHLLLKHRFHEESYAQTIDASRRARGVHPFEGVEWFKKVALEDGEAVEQEDGKALPYMQRWRDGTWRRRLAEWSSVGIWTWTLIVFAVGDVVIVVSGFLHCIDLWQPFR
jgi:hypothetical protein